MKRKIFSLTLLLSFLLVLSHEMIPHHHHDLMTYESTIYLDHQDNHSHHLNDTHHPHPFDSKKEKKNRADSDRGHNHSFPFHHHFLASQDYDYLRLNINESSQIQNDNEFYVDSTLFSNKLLNPPERGIIQDSTRHLCIIKSLNDTSANLLRAPPVFD